MNKFFNTLLSCSPWFSGFLAQLLTLVCSCSFAPGSRECARPCRPAQRYGAPTACVAWARPVASAVEQGPLCSCARDASARRRRHGAPAPVAGSAWARCKSAGGRRGGAGLPVRGARRPVRAWPRGPRAPGATSAGGRALAAGGETAGRPRRRGRRTAGLGRQTAWGEISMMEVESGACLAGSLGGGSRSEEFWAVWADGPKWADGGGGSLVGC